MEAILNAYTVGSFMNVIKSHGEKIERGCKIPKLLLVGYKAAPYMYRALWVLPEFAY